MKRIFIISCLLIAITTVSSAQISGFKLPSKKGAILNAWIEPASPDSETPITLLVSLADNLQLDRVEIRKLLTMYTVRMYWDDLADGGNNSAASTQHEVSLGTLTAGTYSINIQSFYKERYVDSERLSIRVSNAPPPMIGHNIDDVWIEPTDPNTADTITLHVSGNWPTSGYSLGTVVNTTSQNAITLSMHWSSPNGAVLMVVTPYEHIADLGNLHQGTYTVRVESHLDNELVDWAEMSFEVTDCGDSPPDKPVWPWDIWPWIQSDWIW